jgi:hypothetical protein
MDDPRTGTKWTIARLLAVIKRDNCHILYLPRFYPFLLAENYPFPCSLSFFPVALLSGKCYAFIDLGFSGGGVLTAVNCLLLTVILPWFVAFFP